MNRQMIVYREDLIDDTFFASNLTHAATIGLVSILQKNTKAHLNEQRLRAYVMEYDDATKKCIKKPMLYRRQDLSRWAKEAAEHDDSYFYVKPVNPNDSNGKLKLCEPTFTYESKLRFASANWLSGHLYSFCTIVPNEYYINVTKEIANEMGMIEDSDYFVVMRVDNSSEKFGITFVPREDDLLEELSERILDRVEGFVNHKKDE